jgi:uncharacterized protein
MHEIHAIANDTLNALEAFLDSEANENGLDFHGTHGFLTAITVGPRGGLDEAALSALFEDLPPSSDAAFNTQLIEQLAAWQKSIHAALYHGVRLTLPCELIVDHQDSNELNDWCVGFMEGLFLDEDAWYAEHEEDIADMTLPMVVLSELIEDDDLAQIRQDQRIINEMAKQIPELITSLYLLFHAPANA